jgi:myo-inositol-1(or 4)-monophosphatase
MMDTTNPAAVLDEAGLNREAIEELHRLARRAADAGGTVLQSHYGNLSDIRCKGRVGDLVTAADLEAEEVVIRLLRSETPQVGILAEESGSRGPQEGLQWVIDPLDGTTNFAHGYPLFATSVGLCWKGTPLLGAISIPYLHQTYHCCPGLGAFCNDKPIAVSRCESLEDSLLVTGFAYDRHNRLDNNYAEFCWLTHRTRGVRRGGAAAVDLAFVAAGLLDGYWERGLAPWDLAAGVALIRLAGGLVSGYRSEPFDLHSGNVIATGQSIHTLLTDELSKVRPLDGAGYGAPEIGSMGS